MPWQPLPRIAFAVATYPFQASTPADLPLELGDELYIIEQGGKNGGWFRGYLIAPPSLLAGLTSVKGQTLEARVFSGIFPRSCVEIREVLGDDDEDGESQDGVYTTAATNGDASPLKSDGSANSIQNLSKRLTNGTTGTKQGKGRRSQREDLRNGTLPAVARDPDAPKPPAPVPMLNIGDETPTSVEEPLVDEIASCLREWHSTNVHELLLARQYPMLDKITSLVQTLDISRRQFLHNVLTIHELELLREKTIWDLVEGNKLMSGEVVVRSPSERGRVLTGDDSPVEITSLQSMMSCLDEKPQPAVESLALHHLLVDIKGFVGASTDKTTLVLYLASKSPGGPAVTLSESYTVEIPGNGNLSSLAKSAPMRTLFTDLASADIGDTPAADSEIFLVVTVQQNQQPLIGRPSESRGGMSTKDDKLPAAEKSIVSSVGKTARRSLMWGKTAQRNAYTRNSPISKLNALSEQDDRPPTTASAKTGSPPRTATNKVVSRTVGIGVVKLNLIMKQDAEMERVLKIWSPSTKFDGDSQNQGEGWDEIIRELLDSKTGYYEKSRQAERVHLNLRPFVCPDGEALIKATPTLLANINRTCKIGFSGAPTKPRSDIYVTIDKAFLPRHALLSRSSGSATILPTNIAGSNLQLVLEVRKASGEKIENCIFSSSNGEATSSWESVATERGEAWNQTIRLSVPPNEVPGCHLAMMIADAPYYPFAIAHIPLWHQDAFVRDGHHSLLLYKYDDITSHTRPDTNGKGGYLGVPWNSRGKDDISKDEAITGPISTLRIQTYLCSTRFSQDKVLLGLLHWKEQPVGDLQKLLKRLVFVPEIEIVKLLNDVLDSLFAIIVEHAGNDTFEDQVLNALVTVLGIVHDRRFNLGPLVDYYAENKFHYPFATPCLVRSFIRLLSNPSDPETSKQLRATFKVTRHILKFITHARNQQKAKEADIGITSSSPGFSRHIRSVFKALDALMRNTSPILVGSQTLAVQHFHSWLPELQGMLTTEEILHIAIDFMDSCANVKGKLVLFKLVLLINFSKLQLFSQDDQRSALAANTVRWIAPHWGKTAEVTPQWHDQVRLCCSVLATQIDMLGPEVPDHIPKIIDSYLAIQRTPRESKTRLSLLFPSSYPLPSKPLSGQPQFDEALVELSAILSAISNLPQGMQLELAEDEMATLLDDTLKVQMSILQCEAFPKSWLSVHIYHHKSAMRTLEYIAGILLESFLPHPDDAGMNYNTDLWKAFFTTLLKLVGSDALALETFPEQKRRAVWKIAGDIRETGADLLRRTWEAIGWETSLEEKQRYGLQKMGGYQVQYVPGLVGPIIELCLSVHEGLRHMAVEVLETMIASEWNLSEDLTAIQTEMIESLDRLFKSRPLTESILQKLFINELLDLFEPLSRIPNDALYLALNDLIATIDEFLDLLVAVYSGDSTGEASSLIDRLRLMDFLRDMQKEDIFIRYVHQLATVQAETRNFTEAGLALHLHADLLEWDPSKMLSASVDPDFPAQSAFERKERIYFDMIKHFEDGEAWSSALIAYKELQTQYEETTFDFSKLARTQRSIATVYESITKNEKPVLKYFRVQYRGLGFPIGVRDKEFVFEGAPMEKTSAFTDRLQEQHPAAQIVSAFDSDEVEGQFLRVSALSVHRNLEHPVFQRSKVSHVIRDYLLSAQCQQFSTTVSRNTRGPVQEHWAEKLVYATADQFPTISRRSEIISCDRIRLSPLQTALERVIRKTQEMAAVEKRVNDGEFEMNTLLIEALKISVNDESDSSIARYRELLPTSTINEDDEELEPEINPMENALKMALIDHAIMIRRCLIMFSKSNNTLLRSSHGELSLCKFSQHTHFLHYINIQADFEITFAPELATFNAPQARGSTPVPAWSLSSPRVLSPPAHMPSLGTNSTMQTANTSMLDTPSHQRPSRQERSRLSFLGGRHKDGPPVSFRMNGKVNGNVDDDASSSRSRSKENRRSFFGGGKSDNGDGGDGDWVTDYGRGDAGGGLRRSNSTQRPDTATSVGSRVGSVRKRLSRMKLGSKRSKANVVEGLVEEE
jgi:dedicator of cytokinesis protein 3